jgi:hypothetical protein
MNFQRITTSLILLTIHLAIMCPKVFPQNDYVPGMEQFPNINCPISPSLEYELKALNKKELKKNLKDYLSDGQIDALLKRRDHILELCVGNNQ